MSISKYFISVLFVCFFTQGWSQMHSKNKGWLRINQNAIVSDSYFDSDSRKVGIRTNALYSTSLSGEYGVTDRLTAVIDFPFYVRTLVYNLEFNQSGNTLPGKSLNSLGDADVGARFAFRKKFPFQVIGVITMGLPIGKVTKVGSETDLQTGDGEFNQLVGVQVFQQAQAFLFLAYSYFNKRSQNFSNEIRYGFQAGYTLNKVGLRVRFNAIESLFNKTAPVSLNGIFSNHREIFAPGCEVNFGLSKSLLFVGSADFPVAGRNTLFAPVYGVGLKWIVH